ncbi:MAG: transketolase [Candidatus Anstonellales archaeon]
MVRRQRVDSDKELKLIANTIRQDVVKMVGMAKSGHVAGALGLAEIFSVLFFSEMNFDVKNPRWEERDRFVLSNGHVCAAYYSAMAHAGYFPINELDRFRQLGSPLQGHPSRKYLAFIENSSGPLGEGLGVSCGIALAMRLDGRNARVYCITSDGEHQEGSTWEAVLFAAKYGLDNLTVIMDRNYIQIDGNTEEIMPLEPIEEKYRAFNWNVISIDGNNIVEIKDALANAKKTGGKPTMIIARTVPGKGVSFMERNHRWHGTPPKEDETKRAIAELEAERRRIEME